MGERTGRITFINSHDYVSDVDGTQVTGCMASLTTDDGTDVILYTQSLRLHHTLEMAYAAKCEMTVDYFDKETSPTEQRPLALQARDGESPRSFSGPFRLKAMWTLE
jgi:hypothetical protein